MKIRDFVLIACILMHAAFPAKAGVEHDFFDQSLPAGISLGLTAEQVRALCPAVVRIDSLGAAKNNTASDFTLVDTSRAVRRISYFYYIRDGKLRAIAGTQANSGDLAVSISRETGAIYRKLVSRCSKISIDKILRSSGLSIYEVSAEYWSDKESSLSIYFIATNRETTLIVFDSSYIHKDRFFIDSSQRASIEEGMARLRSKLKKSNEVSVWGKVEEVVDLPRPMAKENSRLLMLGCVFVLLVAGGLTYLYIKRLRV